MEKRYNNNKPFSLTKLILYCFILQVFHSAFISCFLSALPAYVRLYEYVCGICRPYLCFIRNINYCFEKIKLERSELICGRISFTYLRGIYSEGTDMPEK
jgi:ABC-type polysaccharide/polyol phosphate export permease